MSLNPVVNTFSPITLSSLGCTIVLVLPHNNLLTMYAQVWFLKHKHGLLITLKMHKPALNILFLRSGILYDNTHPPSLSGKVQTIEKI